MQAAGRRNERVTWTKVEVIGVGKDNTCSDVNQVGGGEALNRRLRADRHEDGRQHWAVRRAQNASSGAVGPRFGNKIKGSRQIALATTSNSSLALIGDPV
jgi:hypothetical protein